MSKSTSVQRRTAREKTAAMREADRKRDARRRNILVATSTVVIIVLVLLIAVGVKLSSKPAASTASSTTAASASLVAKVSGVPAATLESIGDGGVKNPILPATGDKLLDGKLPLVVYMGAEYCPYCAAERWPVIVALSRFGTFTNLQVTRSGAAPEVSPDTPTFSFHGATYTSKYLAFQGVEMQTNSKGANGNYTTLDTPTAAQNALLTKYDAPPYVSADSQGAIPFVDFGNQAVLSGASYSPDILAGLTQDQVADKIVASDPIGKAIGGTANQITAMLCKMTGNQPSTVCLQPSIVKLRGTISAAK
jgi:hypothetical protein